MAAEASAFLGLFHPDVGPAHDGADHVVEIVRDSPGKLADGFELLRLQELLFEGQALCDILNDDFRALAILFGVDDAAAAEPYGDDFVVFAFPFDGGLYVPTGPVPFAEFRRCRGITVKRSGVTNGEKFFGGVVSQHADECRIYGEKIPFAGDPEHSVSCVLDQASIASFAGTKRVHGAGFGVAQLLFFARSNQRGGKAGQLVFQDVIGDSLLDTFHCETITQRARDEN